MLMIPSSSVIALTLLGYFLGQPSGTPIDPDWIKVADSEWIVQARLEVPRDKLEQAIRTGQGEYVRLILHPAEFIKRPTGYPDITIAQCWYWTGPGVDLESPKEVMALDGREVLVFIDPDGCLPLRRAAISPFERMKADQLRKEVLNQQTIVKDFARLSAAKPDEFEGQIKGLIGKLLVDDTQQETVFSFYELDPRAVPSIIRLMDDRRPLPRRRTLFINPPDSFEIYRHSGPDAVVDVLATVMRRLVRDAPSGQLANGGSEEKRKQVVDAWRVYLFYRTAREESAAKNQMPPPVPKERSAKERKQ